MKPSALDPSTRDLLTWQAIATWLHKAELAIRQARDLCPREMYFHAKLTTALGESRSMARQAQNRFKDLKASTAPTGDLFHQEDGNVKGGGS